jgi:hypothetical protein
VSDRDRDRERDREGKGKGKGNGYEIFKEILNKNFKKIFYCQKNYFKSFNKFLFFYE